MWGQRTHKVKSRFFALEMILKKRKNNKFSKFLMEKMSKILWIRLEMAKFGSIFAKNGHSNFPENYKTFIFSTPETRLKTKIRKF